MNKHIEIEEARQAIFSTLRRIPELADIQVDPETWTEKHRADLLVSFRKQNDRKTLLVEVSSSGQPRLARAAVNSLMTLRLNRPWHLWCICRAVCFRCLCKDLQG